MRSELNRFLICNLQANVEMSLQAITVLNQGSRHEDGYLHIFATPTLEEASGQVHVLAPSPQGKESLLLTG
jgi:hypothetical protein